jgi:aryl-alcohol dehydrogenase-like predicted oxidoreductase
MALQTDHSTALALGCARLGSTLTPLGKRESIALLDEAFALGIRHFDTASIYGQGDSERYLGEALAARRDQVVLATKAGQRLTAKQAVIARFKGPIRWLAARRGNVRQGVADRRAQGVPRCFEPDYVERSLAESLRRLRTDRVDVFYLHSPDPEVLSNERLFDRLEVMRRRGWFVDLGVSCDDAALARVAARHQAVQVVQFAHEGETESRALLAALASNGKRGVLRGLMASPASTLSARLEQLLGAPGLASVIVGTTRIEHLRKNVQAYRDAHARTYPFALSLSKGPCAQGFLRQAQDDRKDKLGPNGLGCR